MSINIKPSKRLQSLGGYAFYEVDKMVSALKDQGINPIDFGVGDPKDEAPKFVRNALKKAVDKYSTSGYPNYDGSENFKSAASKWMKKRFGVECNPKTEICSSIGSKEAIFNFSEAILDPGDIAIIPSPNYPPMKTGTIFAQGKPYFVPLNEENNFLLNFENIPSSIAKQAKVLWINYPNSPTGVCAPNKYYKKLIKWAEKYNIIIAADEGCYIDIYFDSKPHSILETGREGVIAFYSMSKRNNMTGYRVGFVVGDEKLITLFKKLKTNIDSGTPDFIQDAAIAALEDESHAKYMRDLYSKKRDIILKALSFVGLKTQNTSATFYLWQKVPNGMTSLEFTKELLKKDIAIVTTPGSWISDQCEDGLNPGEGYVRLALVPTLKQCRIAAERLTKYLKL